MPRDPEEPSASKSAGARHPSTASQPSTAREVINAAHVRVGDRTGEEQLLFEAPEGPRVAGEIERQSLERHRDSELPVLHFIDFTHPSSAQEAGDPEAAGDEIAGNEDGSSGQRREPAWKLRGSLQGDRPIAGGFGAVSVVRSAYDEFSARLNPV
jgi:hypothetical protein